MSFGTGHFWAFNTLLHIMHFLKEMKWIHRFIWEQAYFKENLNTSSKLYRTQFEKFFHSQGENAMQIFSANYVSMDESKQNHRGQTTRSVSQLVMLHGD